MAHMGTDTSNVETQSYDPVPAGEYQARVVDSKVGQSKSGNQMVSWTWEIQGPQFSGRKVFDHMILSGNPKATEVGLRRLKTMMTALGHPNPNYIRDSDEAHGRECLIKVKVESGGDFGDQNRVTHFKPLAGRPSMPAATPPPHGGQAPARPQASAPRPQAAQPPARPRMPWDKPDQAPAGDEIPF